MRHWQDAGKLIVNPKKRNWWKIGAALFLVFSFTVPCFRSGMRSRLTLFEFIVNHTIWGPPVEFIPEEDYTSIFGVQGLSGASVARASEQGLQQDRNADMSGVLPIAKIGGGYD
jgi:hypothetical protein